MVWPRLLLLLLAATGPLLGLLLAAAAEDGRRVLDDARSQLQQRASLGAEQQGDVLQEANTLLNVLSQVYSVRSPAETPCGSLLRGVVTDHPRIEALAVVSAEGVVTCGSRPGSLGLSIADRDYFKEAIQLSPDGRYVLSGLTISRVSGKPAMFVLVPLPPLQPNEGNAGVMLASVNIEWFSQLRASAPGMANQQFQVIDSRDGRVLTRSPDAGLQAGQRFSEHPLLRGLRASPAGGSLLATDLDGVPRVFGFAPLPDRETGLFLVIGLAEADVRAEASQRILLAIAIALGTTSVAILAAWLVAQRALLQPIQGLAAAAVAVGAGDLSARADLGRGAAQELRNLGATFSRMARRLRDRETELASTQGQLAKSEEHHRLLADAATDMITRFDPVFRRTYVSPASRDLLGYAPEELIGQKPGRIVHPDDWEQLDATLNQPLMAGQVTARASYRALRKDGRLVWLESSGRRLADGSGFVVLTRDVSERKLLETQLEDANRQLRILVRQDGLTGLANRRRFDEVLGSEYRRAVRGNHPLTMFMIDVDRFKSFNDTYGHPAGDACLRALAGVFGAVLRRSGDLTARYGGEEFVILMAETDVAGALALAERVRMAVRDLAIPHAKSEAGIVTISVGVAVLRPSSEHPGPAALVEAADAALYAAKAGGRDRVRLAQDSIVQPL